MVGSLRTARYERPACDPTNELTSVASQHRRGIEERETQTIRCGEKRTEAAKKYQGRIQSMPGSRVPRFHVADKCGEPEPRPGCQRGLFPLLRAFAGRRGAFTRLLSRCVFICGRILVTVRGRGIFFLIQRVRSIIAFIVRKCACDFCWLCGKLRHRLRDVCFGGFQDAHRSLRATCDHFYFLI